MGQSVIYLDEAVTLSAFRAGHLDVELSSSHQLHGFLADVLQVIEEGLEGWSIISRDDAAQHFLVSLEEQLLFIREIFLDFIEVGSIVTWLLIFVLILLVFFHVFRIFMLLLYCLFYCESFFCLTVIYFGLTQVCENLFQAALPDGLGAASGGIRCCSWVPSLRGVS